MRQDLRAVFFDLDDTLWSRHQLFQEFVDGIAGQCGALFPGGELPGNVRALCDRLRQSLGAAAPSYAAVAAAWVAKLERDLRPAPGVVALVRDLASRYRIAVVSNGPAALQRLKCRLIGVSGALDATIISGAVGAEKPDPRIFRAALEAVACQPHQALMVGDDPVLDMAGAAALGLRTCHIDAQPSSAPCTADLRLASVELLREVLLP